MLDDLDALMERMLSLPVGDAEELPPLPRDVMRAPTVSASLTMLDEPALDEPALEDDAPAVEEESPAPLAAPRDIRHSAPEVSYAFAEDEPATIEPPPIERLFLNVPQAVESKLPPPLQLERPIIVSTSPIEPGVSLGSVLVQPLFWANACFDWSTQCLGPIGTGLRSRVGRTLLGFLGLMSLFIAAAWFAREQLGWPW
jgi:hypothetical protein